MRDSKGRFIKGCGFWKGKKRPPMSEEWKKKISEAHKKSGLRPPSTIGMKWTDEHKKKISMATKGRKFSEESRERMRKGQMGKTIPIETRLKISTFWKENRHKKWNWKGGITPINKVLRGSIEYRLWREAIFKRDNWTCQECQVRGGKLHADHIKQFAFYPELRFAINNGRTLCVPCHRKTDTWGRQKIKIDNEKFALYG